MPRRSTTEAIESVPSMAAPSAVTPNTSEHEYTVVARRYRPQQFVDLIGQETVARAITNAIKSDRVAHAYLFTGARGVGKTSTARILAKCLNCEKGPTPTPCDRCEICLSIMSGQDIDVQEIDGASNRKIEDVRIIREAVTTKPTRSRYKIYIIDEVHMLTREAFNALLKTLEEPPPHVKFIFATTEIQKVPITILSRCQRFDFGGINTQKIALHLQQVVKTEGLHADEEAVRMIARRAGGSMRDAQSLLEQLISGAEDGKLTTEHVRGILGAAAEERVIEIAEAILLQDAGRALNLVNAASEEGVQLGEVFDQLVMFWRGLMLAKVTGPSSLDLSEVQRTSIAKLLDGVHLDTILAGLDILSTSKTKLRAGGVTQIILEMAVVRLSRLQDLIPITQLAEALNQPGRVVVNAPSGGSGNLGSLGDPAKKNGLLTGNSSNLPKSSAQNGGPNPNDSATPLSAANAELVWTKVLEVIPPMLRANVEKAGMPSVPQAISGPKVLVLRFPVRYNTAFEYCRNPERTQNIETAVRKVTAQDWAVRVEVDTSSTGGGATPTAPVLSNRDIQKQALEHPLMSQIVAKLEGRLMRMDEGFGQPPAPKLDKET